MSTTPNCVDKLSWHTLMLSFHSTWVNSTTGFCHHQWPVKSSPVTLPAQISTQASVRRGWVMTSAHPSSTLFTSLLSSPSGHIAQSATGREFWIIQGEVGAHCPVQRGYQTFEFCLAPLVEWEFARRDERAFALCLREFLVTKCFLIESKWTLWLFLWHSHLSIKENYLKRKSTWAMLRSLKEEKNNMKWSS